MASTSPEYALERRVWNGRLPLEIVLSPSECRTYDRMDPYLVSDITDQDYAKAVGLTPPQLDLISSTGLFTISPTKADGFLFYVLN